MPVATTPPISTSDFSFTVSSDELLPDAAWRYLVKRRADFSCEQCGGTSSLHAHHIDEDQRNNRLMNGRCLCNPCHRALHNTLPSMVAKLRGRKHSEEHKRKLSEAMKRAHERGAYREAPEKIRAALIGRTLPEEHRAALRAGQARRRERERQIDHL